MVGRREEGKQAAGGVDSEGGGDRDCEGALQGAAAELDARKSALASYLAACSNAGVSAAPPPDRAQP
jgi:hypothetical protein